MNSDQDATVAQVFGRKTKRLLRKFMGGAFDITLEDDGKKLRIQFRQQDSGNELMTYGDVAAFLNLELSTVRQMTKTRSRNKTGFPAPVDIGGPKIRRSQLLKWIQSKTKARAGKRTKE